MMDLAPIAPCQVASVELQYVIAVLGALNTALATWLVNRRARADKRENGKHSDGPQHESLEARRRRHDEGGPSGRAHRPE